jgi:hypothetical protein
MFSPTCFLFFALHGRATYVRLTTARCGWYAGPLSCWSRETALLHAYHGFPQDAYELGISDTFPTCGDEFLTHKLSRHVGSGGLAAIGLSYPLFVGVWADTEDDVLVKRRPPLPEGPAPGGCSGKRSNDSVFCPDRKPNVSGRELGIV